MPDLKGCHAVVVCEDRRQFHFVRGYLMERGMAPGRIRRRQNPSGCGYQWTSDVFAAELAEFRRRAKSGNRLLVAVIDEDGQGLDVRKRLVADSARMRDLGVAPRTEAERALILVPARAIENWFAFVEDGTTDEGANLKGRYRHAAKPGKWGRELARRCQSVPPRDLAGWPASLRDACGELERLG